MNNNTLIISLCLLAIMLVYPLDAHAYINPSIFSFIGILLAGAITVIGFYFFKIVGFLEILFSKIKNLKK
tara:strand:- start:398 stop:607 length:210 start_codon:yes stop_codon:yes gene_type:complete